MELKVKWRLEDEISKFVNEPSNIVNKVISLLKQDNTVPFISRYRQEMTKGMAAEKIRNIKERMEELQKVEKKSIDAVKLVMKLEKADKALEQSILECVDEAMIDELVAPFKPSKKPSKLKEALSFNLEHQATKLLAGDDVNLYALVDKRIKALNSMEGVREVVTLIMADSIANQSQWLNHLSEMCKYANDVYVTSKQMNSKKTSDKVDMATFRDYFDFKVPVHRIKPYKYLAIQRGKSLNVLKTDIEVPARIKTQILHELRKHYHHKRNNHSTSLLEGAFEMAYDKFLNRRLLCLIRKNLWNEAESAAIKSFSRNLSQLLLEQPVREQAIMGIDPGFTNGCKFAVINKTGEVVSTGKVFLHSNVSKQQLHNEALKIKEALVSANCELVAIGNGVGSRQTEQFLASHINIKTFFPLNVVFCIVSEAGASVYSASKQADQELPEMNVALRGAVSIARRTQDPLVELIKIDPKNLGVGMYQHDLTNSKLKKALDGVVEDCVSFVGVDLNVCGAHLLQHVAGIGPSLARKIVARRGEMGGFRSRQQLMEVPGLGAKIFTQCSGFLRIMGSQDDDKYAAGVCGDNNDGKNKTLSSSGHQSSNQSSLPPPSSSSLATSLKRKGQGGEGVTAKRMKRSVETNSLDRTSVHPEAYPFADKLMVMAGLQKRDVGSGVFADVIKKFHLNADMKALASTLDCSAESIQQILQSLEQISEFDIRSAFGKPLVRQSIQRMADLKVGDVLQGKVMNLTDFGAFVDVGVEREGLIHVSQLNHAQHSSRRSTLLGYSAEVINLGDMVTVSVLNVEVKLGRLGLRLCRVIN